MRGRRWPVSLNRLLVYWLAGCVPVAVLVAVFWNGLLGAGLCVVSWTVLRLLNRRAWKRHFRPRVAR